MAIQPDLFGVNVSISHPKGAPAPAASSSRSGPRYTTPEELPLWMPMKEALGFLGAQLTLSETTLREMGVHKQLPVAHLGSKRLPGRSRFFAYRVHRDDVLAMLQTINERGRRVAVVRDRSAA